jgi:ubiquinone/menaquinone biosynthesis C-methylase UbiE
VLDHVQRDSVGIWRNATPQSKSQSEEMRVRESVAEAALQGLKSENLSQVAAQHHSIPVMTRALTVWLKKLPQEALVIDVGAGWSWVWSKVLPQFPNVAVILFDFSYSSLKVSQRILSGNDFSRYALVQGDATDLRLGDEIVDGYWSVQCLQHIPAFSSAVTEAHRVLRPKGQFINWSLNNAVLARQIYHWLGKKYHVQGKSDSWSFELNRASTEQIDEVKRIFQRKVRSSYSEIIFQPDFRTARLAQSPFWGNVDRILSTSFVSRGFSWIARQRSMEVQKL